MQRVDLNHLECSPNIISRLLNGVDLHGVASSCSNTVVHLRFLTDRKHAKVLGVVDAGPLL